MRVVFDSYVCAGKFEQHFPNNYCRFWNPALPRCVLLAVVKEGACFVTINALDMRMFVLAFLLGTHCTGRRCSLLPAKGCGYSFVVAFATLLLSPSFVGPHCCTFSSRFSRHSWPIAFVVVLLLTDFWLSFFDVRTLLFFSSWW